MVTSRRLLVAPLLAGVALWAGHAGTARADKPGPADKPAAESLYLPAYPSLLLPQMRSEVGLTEDQVKRLREIGRAFQKAAWKQSPQVNWSKLTDEERKKKTEEIRQEYDRWAADFRKRTEESRQQIDALLTPEQAARLQEIELRTYAAPLLLYGGTGDKLALTERQKEQLSGHKDALQKRLAQVQEEMRQAQDQAHRAALQVLTPEQREQLKKLKQEGYRWMGQPVTPKK